MSRHRCDLVMKGGITSGVVFPSAIRTLSETYDFHNVAGTSAGAIAAAFAAAAQYGRNVGAGDRFAELEDMSRWLGDASSPRGPSNLCALFQPTPDAEPVFDVAVALAGDRSPRHKLQRVAARVLFSSPRALLGGIPGLLALAGLVAAGGPDALRALPAALAVVILSVVGGLAAYAITAAITRSRASRAAVPVLAVFAIWIACSRPGTFPDPLQPWLLPEMLGWRRAPQRDHHQRSPQRHVLCDAHR